MSLIILLIVKLSAISVLSSPSSRFTNYRPDYKESVVMADIIGSGALNLQHYFHTLGIVCENRNPGLWVSINRDYTDCEEYTSKGTIKDFLHGSFANACTKRDANRQCETNLAIDLDNCLGAKQGTDALKFMDAYTGFTCGNIRNTEAHLVDRYTKRNYLAPGAFRCFPELQDRISNCVKNDVVSNSICSQFYSVHQCYGKYYTDEDCNDPQAIVFMRDLFHSMSSDLKCPQTEDDWYHRVYQNRRGPSTSSARPPYEIDPYFLTSRRPPPTTSLPFFVSSTRRPSVLISNRHLGTPRSSPATVVEYPYLIPSGVIGTNFDQRVLSTSVTPVSVESPVSSTTSPININDQYIFISTTGGSKLNVVKKRKKISGGTARTPTETPETSSQLRVPLSTLRPRSKYFTPRNTTNYNRSKNVFRSYSDSE